MASLPQSAFAVHKIRQAKTDKHMTIARFGTEKQGQKFMNNSTMDLTPVKYNDKLMNSIWGLYNRYSPHNFKKNNGSGSGFFGMPQPFAVACAAPERNVSGVNSTAQQQ